MAEMNIWDYENTVRVVAKTAAKELLVAKEEYSRNVKDHRSGPLGLVPNLVSWSKKVETLVDERTETYILDFSTILQQGLGPKPKENKFADMVNTYLAVAWLRNQLEINPPISQLKFRPCTEQLATVCPASMFDGTHELSCSCMIKAGHCSKHFPEPLSKKTSLLVELFLA